MLGERVRDGKKFSVRNETGEAGNGVERSMRYT